MTNSHSGSRGKLIVAFAALYIIWGSTYLAIRYAVETMPPFLMAGTRFLVGGAIMYAVARSTGERTMGRRGWKSAIVLGLLLLVGGNGGVVWAEQSTPSGVAAVLVATTPMWIAILDWIRPGGKRPPALATVGILIGFLGTALLIQSGRAESSGPINLIAAAVLVGAALSWSGGTVYGRRVQIATSTTMTTGMQMLCGGTVLMVLSGASGEWYGFELSAVSRPSMYALIYLIVFGGFFGFNAFNYLVRHTSSSRVATYAYVNPAVAVFLGWAIAGEPIKVGMLFAIAVIIASVVLVTIADGSSQDGRTSKSAESKV